MSEPGVLATRRAEDETDWKSYDERAIAIPGEGGAARVPMTGLGRATLSENRLIEIGGLVLTIGRGCAQIV